MSDAFWPLLFAPSQQGDVVVNQGQDQVSQDQDITFHHEGFFWRCSFNEITNDDDLWKFWFGKRLLPLLWCNKYSEGSYVVFQEQWQKHVYGIY